MYACSYCLYGLAQDYCTYNLKLYMWVHVGHMSIHAKFHDPDGHRIAEMAKKPIFWIFQAFFEYFFVEKQ